MTQEIHFPRTGLIGRLARTLLLAITLLVLYSLFSGGIHKFDKFAFDITLWIQTGLALLVLKDTLEMSSTRIGYWIWLWGLVGIALVGMISSFATSGIIWASPVPELVWGVNVVGFVILAIEFLLSIVIGTPGCEKGVISELLARSRGEPTQSALSCIIGLHRLDSWEAQRRGKMER